MGDGERQTQACVLINGTAPVLAAHPTNWSKTCKKTVMQFHKFYITHQLFHQRQLTQFQHKLQLIDYNVHCQAVFTLTLTKNCL